MGLSSAQDDYDPARGDRSGVLGIIPAAVISATMQRAVNVALWQNHVPVLTELTLMANSPEAAGEIAIDLTCEPPVIGPRSWHLQGVAEGQEILAELKCDIRLLAHNEWGGSAGIPDILAAFVEPNDPTVSKLLHLTSDHLRTTGKPDGLEGYRAKTKARIWEQVEALWRAIGSLDIRYVNPAPSFEQTGQKIRPPSQILTEKLATCLDLAVLFAACIEAIGIRPVIVLIRDHAFAGFWLTRHDFGSSVADDAPGLRTRLALHDLLLFETTLVCGRGRSGFKRACEAGEAHVTLDKDEAFEAVIDIHRARQRRIRPLNSNGGSYALKMDVFEDDATAVPLPFEEPPPLREDPQTDPEVPPTTPDGRLERWRKRLLDLSGRNRLLNLQIGGKQALAIDCPDPAQLENKLVDMRGRTKAAPLRFRPWPDLMKGSDPRSAKIHQARLQEDADRSFAREAMERHELMVGRDDATLQATLTEIFRTARAAQQQEGGTYTLFLTVGALLWRQKGKDKPYRAPIVLVPVMLERPSIRSGFSLRAHEDDARINATLLEMLKQEFDIRFPTLVEGARPPADDSGIDVKLILDTFRAKLRDIPGWEVTDEVILTNLSFTKYLMWKDLIDRAQALRASELACRQMDGPNIGTKDTGLSAGGATDGSQGKMNLDEVAAHLVCPLEADSSQLQAVAAAHAGKSFVLIGPPRTGKSQTIANIIADTLAQGRTVLFVAQKRAALEVVQRRLRHIGLGDFCLDLFSAKTSKALVLEQMNRAQQAQEDFDAEEWSAASKDAAALRSELNQYVGELHKRCRNGWTPFRAMGCVLRAETAGVPEIAFAWPDAEVHDAVEYQRLVELVEDAAAVLTRVGDVTAAAALSGVAVSGWSPPWQSKLLEAARTSSSRLEALADAAVPAGHALALADVSTSRPALIALKAMADLLLDPIARDADWATRDGADALIEMVRAEAARVARHGAVRATLTVAWHPEAMALPLKEIHAQWTATKRRWAVPRVLARRGIRRQLATATSESVPVDLDAELGRLVELQAIDNAVSAAGAHLSTVLGPRWRGLETDFERVEAGFDWARRLRAAAAACAQDTASLQLLREHLRRLVSEGADLLALEGAVGGALRRFCSSWKEAETALESLATLCGVDPAGIVDATRVDWATALASHLQGWGAAARHLRDWCAWRGVVQRAGMVGLEMLLGAMETGLVAPAEAPRVFEVNYARWWVGLAVEASTRLKGFVAAQHENRIERFRALDMRLLSLAARLTRATLAGAIPGKTQREHDPEYAVLARELAKRQRHLPVRQLAERMPHAIRRLMPCLMMSPLSVAQYLPANAEPFDLIVFDEASQIPTWDAIGAIGRGRQVVVVGDPKQLPPTRFFERQIPDREGDGETIEVEIEDLESILDECIGAGIPSFKLTWHYRSRHESLIAFSNKAYYGGRLITFPSPVTEDKAVSFRHVPDGVYARAGARTNQPEARALVAEAISMLREVIAGGRDRSLGIVTFNAEQQALIENLLDEARRQDPLLEPFFSDEATEPVLIKNLESVQGEERDVMLFSLTYGPDQTGRIGMNFGPLNQAGGERRLNVAVTRAREALIVFGSLRPEHIDLSRTSAIGVAHLKQFLNFALYGARAFATAATGPLGDFESSFEAAVAERLGAKGWILRPQIGVSGFRIDLGVVDPDAQGAFLAGVECDGATYHRGATARDRDRLRQAVLEGLGWRILRIWSTDWWTNSARETDRLHLALEAALIDARTKRDIGNSPVSDAIIEAHEEMPQPSDVVRLPPLTETAIIGCETQKADASPARFYDDDYRPVLAGMVVLELASSGPLRQDRLIQRIARIHGFQRAGREIQERVVASVPKGCRETSDSAGTFCLADRRRPVELQHLSMASSGRVPGSE
jgi:very-short-patch-repair endonuclease